MRLISVIFAGLISLSAFGQDLNTALKLTKSEQYEDAEQTFKALLEKEPANGNVYFYYGEALLKDYTADTFSTTLKEIADRAEILFQKGIQVDSLNALNYIGMGSVILMRTSDTLKADKYFNRAESFIPKKKKSCTPVHAVILMKMGNAQMYGHVNRYYKAIAFLNRAKEIDPLNPDIFLTAGDVYIKNNDGTNSLSNYNKALQLDPKSPLPKIKIGNIYMRVPNLTAARPYFEEARQIDSTFAPVYRELGELYTMAGRYDLAKQNFARFLELSGNNIPAKVRYGYSLFKSKDYAGALSIIEEVLAVDKSRNYLNRLAAYCAFDKKPSDPEKALKYMEEFFKNTRPDEVLMRDYTYYGRILYKLAEPHSLGQVKAFDQFKQAYQYDSNDLGLINEIASDYYYSRWYEQAIEWYNKKIEKGKPDIYDHMFVGKSYYQLNQFLKADSVFTAVANMQPDFIQAYLYSARSWAGMDPNNELGLAKPKFELMITKIGTDTTRYSKELEEAYSYMGSYYLFQKKPDYVAAIGWFRRIYTLDPKNKQWQIKALKSMALAAYKQKSYTDARDYYVQVQKLEPNDPDAPKAIKDLTKAIEAAKNQ
jgi:tetratricopeptide (TPR) repeat protein